MHQPDGFDDGTRQVLKIHQVLYGLKQSGRVWHQHLCRLLLSLRFQQSIADECVYIREHKDSIEARWDMWMTSACLLTPKEGWLRSRGSFTRNSLWWTGEIKKILGIRIERNREQGMLTMSQGHYINIILAWFNMTEAHLVSMPLHKMIKLNTPLDLTGPTIEVPYAKVISSLTYVALSTWPNLAFTTIQHLSQYITSYGAEQWTTIKQVLRYLKGSCDDRITFNQGACLKLKIFVDSDYANRMDTLSINECVAILGGGSIAWSSKK